MNWWRRLSIAAKLPLGIGTLLLIVLGGMTTVAYFEVRRAVGDLANERLNRVTLQLADLFGTSARQRHTVLDSVSRRTDVRVFLRAPDDSVSRAAMAALTRGARASRTDAFEIWDARGQRLIQLGSDLPPVDEGMAARLISKPARGRRAVTGRLVHVGDRLMYAVIAPVGPLDEPAGYVVERLGIHESPESVRSLTELVGAESAMLIGNAGGDLWADLTGSLVAAPPIDVRGGDVVSYARPDVGSVLARASAIPSTPWILTIELPRGPVLAPARHFLARSIVLSILLAAGGAIVGWLMSRRISRPLVRVTEAAEALAAARDVPPVPVVREDEVGRLAASFNVMADRVLDYQRDLEQKVTERTAALQAVNHELEAFCYSVSHDLRSPLRAIDGFSTILQQDFASQLEPEALGYLQRVRAAAQRMDRLISDLLNLSRLSRQELRGAQVNLSRIAADVTEDLRAAQSDRSVDVVLAPDLFTTGDPNLLRVLLMNLLGNAWKFTAKHQHARIEFGAMNGADGGRVYFVRDDGAGFDQKYAGKLFGAFQRLHAASDFEGTGVGLATVQRIIHRHRGRIWAEGALDAGATFYFTLSGTDPNHGREEDHPARRG